MVADMLLKVLAGFGVGHQLEQTCWLGVVGMRLWQIVMKFPELRPAHIQQVTPQFIEAQNGEPRDASNDVFSFQENMSAQQNKCVEYAQLRMLGF